MKTVKYILIFALVALVFLGGTVQAQTLYGISHEGANGLSTLHIINQNTGAVITVGPIGFERCGGMDFDAAENLFATCERTDGSDLPVLVEINHLTGAGTEVGPTDNCSTWTDMSFRNSDNTLFATGFDDPNCSGGGNWLTTISTGTGLSTIVGPMNNTACCGNAMAFILQTEDLLFLDGDFGPPDNLYNVNQNTGAAFVIAGITYPPVLDRDPRINAMAFNLNTDVLFASIVNGGGGKRPPGENFLGTINFNSGVVTVIGPTVDGLDAIAFGPLPPRNVPTLSEWGLIAMAVILGIVGFMVIRRRKVTA